MRYKNRETWLECDRTILNPKNKNQIMGEFKYWPSIWTDKRNGSWVLASIEYGQPLVLIFSEIIDLALIYAGRT